VQIGYNPLQTRSGYSFVGFPAFVPDDARKYGPAPLDFDSFQNGILKFDHPHYTISLSDQYFLLDKLIAIFFPFCFHSRVLEDGEIEDKIVRRASSSYPWSQFCAPTKGEVIDLVGVKTLLQDFYTIIPLHSACCKDELRVDGKDARLYRPAGMSLNLMGVKLFYDFNERLVESRKMTPYSIGYSTPGVEMRYMWQDFWNFGGDMLSADGKQWDAHFPLWAVSVIIAFRKRFLPVSVWDEIERYYQFAYAGFTNCAGNIVRLIGNPSGHFCTATDNTLLSLMNMWLCMKNCNVSSQDVMFKACGDDLTVSVRGGKMTAESIVEDSASRGVFLEFIASKTPFFECVFVGTHPVHVPKQLMGYTYRTSILAAFGYRYKDETDLLYVQKCCSICALFYFSPFYEVILNYIFNWCDERNIRNLCQPWLRTIVPQNLNLLYNGYESSLVVVPPACEYLYMASPQ